MVTDRGVSTAVDTVLAVSLVAAAVTALVVLAPPPTAAPPDAAVALDALAVSTATMNASEGPVRATLATHLAAAARASDGRYASRVEAAVERELRGLPGRANLVVLRNGTREFIAGPTPPRAADANAASLSVSSLHGSEGSVTLVLRRWWA